MDLPALGEFSPQRLRTMVLDRAAQLPLRRSLIGLRAWAEPAFWAAVARRALDPRGLALRVQWRRRGLAPEVFKLRLRSALSHGLIVVLARKLVIGSDGEDGHGRALERLRTHVADERPQRTSRERSSERDRLHRDPGDVTSHAAWDAFFGRTEDPWNYAASEYERLKYEETLELLPSNDFETALELGCAEGLFTERLAPKVRTLIAADISSVALQRAQARCAGFSNIKYQVIDFVSDPVPAGLDLIVCSEALYYSGSRRRLRQVAAKLAESLRSGGVLLTTNANQVADEPNHPGFDWGADLGSKTIGETLSAAGLQLEREIETPLYRVQAFRKGGQGSARREQRPLRATLEPEVSRSVLWEGGVSRAKLLRTEVSVAVPILMYHRVAPTGLEALSRFRVTPQRFADHLELLRRTGHRSISLDELRAARTSGRPLPGRPVLITFDDGYADFAEHAWPILQRRGFEALVFLVSDHVGGRAVWDSNYGQPAPLLDWPEIRALQAAGVEFGSHGASHRKLTNLPTEEVYREALRSRRAFEEELGEAPMSLCYPHGDYDGRVASAVGECGYELAFACREGLSPLTEDPMALSRLEVTEADDAQSLAAKLGLAHA